MNTPPNKDIVIIGAGLIGSLLGVTLQKNGYNVSIYERYSDIRSIPSIGRSINLVLTSRGLRAVSLLGKDILDEMVALATPVYGRVVHQADGRQAHFQPYGKDNSEYNLSISRFELNKFLINKAIAAGVRICFDQKVVACDFDQGRLTVEHVQEKAPQVIGGDLEAEDAPRPSNEARGKREEITITGRLIGADGGGSAIRYALRDAGLITFEEKMVSYCYKELIFPAECAKSMTPRGLHIWPQKAHFLMALVNKDGSFTGTLYLPNKASKGEPSFETLATQESVSAFFAKYYPETVALLGGVDNVCRQFLANPIGHLGFVHTNRFNVGGRVLLIGDACHAIIPFFGQGTNCGFEDVLILTELMARVRHESDFGAAFEQFHLLRKPNADAIAQLSFQNMSEMGEKTADRAFLLFKEVENLIENVIPSKFRSQYAMVCYGGNGNVSYKNALKLGNYQQRIIEDYIKENRITSTKQIDMEAILKLVDEKIVPYQKKLNLDLASISHSNL